jgi:hypothetical protein
MITPAIILGLMITPLLLSSLANRLTGRKVGSSNLWGCIGITLVFCFTGVGHFIQTEPMAEMLPPWVPWRIPLPGRVSIGIVIDSEFIRKFGNTPEEQMDRFLREDPIIRDFARPARRCAVVRYTNCNRARPQHQRNWALLGDAFGFIDPVFSSGLLIAFEARGSPRRCSTAASARRIRPPHPAQPRVLAARDRLVLQRAAAHAVQGRRLRARNARGKAARLPLSQVHAAHLHR